MPIKYDVFRGGRFIYAIATGTLTKEECIEYEVAHATDERVAPPLVEIFDIRDGAYSLLTRDDISLVLERRRQAKRLPVSHKMAICVSYADSHSWDLARFYEAMVMAHSPEVVIVFGDIHIARTWLGVEEMSPEERAFAGGA